MKLSFSTLGCPEWSFTEILKHARDFGYAAVELRGIQDEMRADRMECLKPENEAETKRLLAEYGVAICGFGSSAVFDDPARFGENMEEGEATISVCRRMGIPNVRVFGDVFDQGGRDAVIGRVIRGVGALCGFADDSGVSVLLEVHGNFNTSDAVAPVISALKHHGSFGILWDIANSDLSYGGAYRDFYSLIKPYVRHVHIKDHHRATGQLCRLGEGDVPIGEIVKTLLDDGYDGYFSLEWEKRWHPELPGPEIEFPAYVRLMRGFGR